MVILDEMHRLGLLATSPTVATIDTLYLFPETYAHVAAVEAQYSPPMRLKVMKPRGIDSKEQFEQQFGERLWEKRTKMCGLPPSASCLPRDLHAVPNPKCYATIRNFCIAARSHTRPCVPCRLEVGMEARDCGEGVAHRPRRV
jgi:hypothetical protein